MSQKVRQFIADRYRKRVTAQLKADDLTTALAGRGDVQKILSAIRRPGGNEEAGRLFVEAIDAYINDKALEFADEKIANGSISIGELSQILDGAPEP